MYRLVRMVKRSQVAVMTIPSVYGMWRQAVRSKLSEGIQTGSVYRLVRMVKRSQVGRQVETTRCIYGTLRQAGSKKHSQDILQAWDTVYRLVRMVKTLVSGNDSGSVRLLDVKTGRLKKTLRHSRYVYSVAFSPNGKMLASGGNDHTIHTIRLWDVATGENTKTFRHSRNVHSVAFSPDGKTLASAANTIRLWQLTPTVKTAQR